MEYLTPCPECRGEGRRTQPPYDVRYHDRKLRWRAAEDCDSCGGRGAVPASPSDIAEHERMVIADYAATGMRWVL